MKPWARVDGAGGPCPKENYHDTAGFALACK